MVPARPPLPAVSSFLFHVVGIQSSKRTSGVIVPATRQNAGTLMVVARAVGGVNDPAGTLSARVIVTPGKLSDVRRSQGCCAAAGSASAASMIDLFQKAIARFYCFGRNICGEES